MFPFWFSVSISISLLCILGSVIFPVRWKRPPTPYVDQRGRSARAFLYGCRSTTRPSAAAFLSRTRSAVRLTEHKFNHVQSPDNQNTHRLNSYHTHPNTTDAVIVSSTISVPSFFFEKSDISLSFHCYFSWTEACYYS